MSDTVILAEGQSLQLLEPEPVSPSFLKGFALLEVLLAAGLISFLLVGTAEILVRSISVTGASNRTLSLSGLLGSEIERFKALRFDDTDLAPGPNRITLRTTPDGEPVTVVWSVEAATENVKKVSFTLTRDSRPDRPLEAVLLIARELAPR